MTCEKCGREQGSSTHKLKTSLSVTEIRVLPHGDNNLLLCYRCFLAEKHYRIDRNKNLEDYNKFPLPRWQDLKVYKEES